MLTILARKLLSVTIVAGGIHLPMIAVAVTVGKPAPDFKLPSTTGQEITLSQYRGEKMVLLQFYAINFGST